MRAPTALRMPISRVRSDTLTSMMFMMPMPPTSSEMLARPASIAVSVPRSVDRIPSVCACVKTVNWSRNRGRSNRSTCAFTACEVAWGQ